MQVHALRYWATVLVAAAVGFRAAPTSGIGFVLSESKEELKLNYEVTVQQHGLGERSTGRVTIVLTLADEGRLRPLDEVQLVIPGQEKNEDGGRWMDLVVSIDMKKSENGNRMGRVHIAKELAQRAQIQLNTHTKDGKTDLLSRLHHVIPISELLETEKSGQLRESKGNDLLAE